APRRPTFVHVCPCEWCNPGQSGLPRGLRQPVRTAPGARHQFGQEAGKEDEKDRQNDQESPEKGGKKSRPGRKTRARRRTQGGRCPCRRGCRGGPGRRNRSVRRRGGSRGGFTSSFGLLLENGEHGANQPQRGEARPPAASPDGSCTPPNPVTQIM